MISRASQSTSADADFRFAASLSVFFPAYNDAPSLPELLRKTFETLCRFASDYEVIVVNDGSSDQTGEVLTQLAKQYSPHLRVVTHVQNLGYGAALRSGFAEARKEYIFYTDGDGQYDPTELEQLLRAAGPRTGLVNGYKISRNDPWHRIAIGWLYNRFARWLFGIQLRDIDCDFRLIRRSAFEPRTLQSTGGTICVELVRQLELSGAEVIELPVHHYARQHGRSQFFRIKSLAFTFLQLIQVFLRLVVAPALRTPREDDTPRFRPSAHWIGVATLSVVALSFLAYARALGLPFIADDYVQIQLARDFGPSSKWGALAQDALYRCRATSLVLTYWMEQWFGLDPGYFRLTSVLLHAANGLLVLSLGFWRLIGWKVAALAAGFFAYSQRHSEAVIWFAAVPELLVFFFAMGSLLCWIGWLQSTRGAARWYLGAFACYVLALLSKESAVAVVPLLALVLLAERKCTGNRILAIAPFAGLAGIYFAFIYGARANHLHFNDGTFSLSAPFVAVLVRSTGGLLWVWGAIAAALLASRFFKAPRGVALLGLVWIPLALLPYSFLTYMVRVPSRHTYLASAGMALVVAAGFLAFRNSKYATLRPWLVPAVAALSIVHEAGYIWTVQHQRYVMRAQPTELLLQAVEPETEAVRAVCFPYSHYVADYALMLSFPGRPGLRFELNPESAKHPQAVDLCNESVEGIRY